MFRYGWVHSLSMLLVWKRSETSHHLVDERQNFLQHQRIVFYLFIYLLLLYGKYAKGLQATGACSLKHNTL